MPVDTKHPEYDNWSSRWKRCRDVIAGEDAVKDGGTAYLPKLTGQTEAEYEAYKQRALFFPAAGRTGEGLRGMIYRKPPIFTVPPALEELLPDITQAGVSLQEFSESLVSDLLAVGRAGVLVEYPEVDQVSTLSRADAEGLGLRPYLTFYKAEEIRNWRERQVGGATVLSLIVVSETAQEEVDEFKGKAVQQLRVLDLVSVASDGEEARGSVYRQRIYQKKRVDGQVMEAWMQEGMDIYPRMNGRMMDYIPFRFFDPIDNTPEVKKPPALDLVNVNISHYITMAELEHGRLFAGSPTPVFSGSFVEQPGEAVTSVKLGSSTGIHMTAGSTASFLEFTGQGLTALENAESGKREMMAVLGARILAPEKRIPETAETAAIHRSSENSVLAALANAVSEGLRWCLEVARDWMGATGEVEAALNTDYFPSSLSDRDLTALVAAMQGDSISYDTYFYRLQRLELYPPGWTKEQELAAIAETKKRREDEAGGQFDEIMNAVAELRARMERMGGGETSVQSE